MAPWSSAWMKASSLLPAALFAQYLKEIRKVIDAVNRIER
jgi:hypothetical protein